MDTYIKEKLMTKEYLHQLVSLESERLILEKVNDTLAKERTKEYAPFDATIKATIKQRDEKMKQQVAAYQAACKAENDYTWVQKNSDFYTSKPLKENLLTLLTLLLSSGLCFCVGYFIFHSIVWGIILSVIGAFIGACICVFGFLIWFNFDTSKNAKEKGQRRWKEEIANSAAICKKENAEWRKLDLEIQQLNEQISNMEDNQKNVQKARETAIQTQLTINNKNISVFEEMIKQYLSLDILPPDYRTMDCIITLDHIFRNDLADTVREAILLYEEWVFRGVVIKGMENIVKMLGKLSSQMQYMQQTLDSIDASVSSICSDLYQMLELQEKQNRTQEQILHETQCSRRAAETIQQSNERFVWYAEQHRAGLL